MSAVSAETLKVKYPRYYAWITENESDNLRNILYQLRFKTARQIDAKLGDMRIVATAREDNIAVFERELAKDPLDGANYVFVSVRRAAGSYFKRKVTQDRFVSFVPITVDEAWNRTGIYDFEWPEGSKKGQRLDRRTCEVPETAVPLIRTMSGKDQEIFCLGYVARLRWRDVGGAVGLTEQQARNRANEIIEACRETIGGGIPFAQLPADDGLRDDFTDDPRRRRVPAGYVGPGARVAITNGAAIALTRSDAVGGS